MTQPRRDWNDRRIRVLVPLLAVLGLLLVPVECSRVHGAHSIFLTSRLQTAAAAPESTSGHDPVAGHAGGHGARPHHVPDLAEPMPRPLRDGAPAVDTAGSALSAEAALRASSVAPAAGAADVSAHPRLVPAAELAASPGVPAVLLDAVAALTGLPVLGLVAALPLVPPGRIAPGPEPPPP